MVSDVIAVSSSGDEINAVLTQAEKVAAYKKLSAKGALHLRLLAEEMMSLMRAITGGADGKFWIDDEDGTLRLHLLVRTNTDAQQRKQLLSTSKSGINEANRGFMGKIRAFFEPAQGELMPPGIMPDGTYPEMFWTLRAYRDQLLREVQQERAEALEAWDELEKSVVAHLADDVKVSIRERDAELTVYKKFA